MENQPKKDYFGAVSRRTAKVRWLCKFLKITGFLDVEALSKDVNVKVSRLEKRKGSLPDDAVAQIIENLIWAKMAKRFRERKVKPYTPKIAKNSPTQQFLQDFDSLPFSFEESSPMIFREKYFHRKKNPAILIPGFLPEGNEAFFLVRDCFLKFGSIYYINYPIEHFHKESIFHCFYDMIAQINDRKLQHGGQGRSPYLVGTSFGGHMIITFLKWLRDKGLTDSLRIQGIVLISPVLCIDDLVDATLERQRTLMGRCVAHMLEVDNHDPATINKHLQKAKNIMMKMFTSGRDMMNFESKNLIPVFAIEDDVLSIFKQPEDNDIGYYYRFLEIKKEPPLTRDFLSEIPTLVLFAEGEKDVMSPKSPTMATFSDVNLLRSIFPNGAVEFVYSKNNRKVTHSDLIFQAERFKDHLEPWLSRHAL